jgi:succinoglycan biosynthesis protein ExoM
VCTFKRPQRLEELLRRLRHQRTESVFTYSVVVVDNDHARSAEAVVASCQSDGLLRIDYHHEPNRNIALARNRAVQNAAGDFVAFIDDDEIPVEDWLLRLYQASRLYNADAVLGPVNPQYDTKPPDWVIKGKFFDRPRCPTGTVLPWHNTRTGNVLLARRVFDDGRTLFRPEFRHSEDQDFFKRVTANGRLVVWCDEAVVHEIQGAERFRITYFVKRGLLRGNVSLRLQPNKLFTVCKSAVAFALYTVALPVLAFIRPHLAIVYLVKDSDHLGKLMAACRIDIQELLT